MKRTSLFSMMFAALILMLSVPGLASAEPATGPMDFMKGQVESVFLILDREVVPGSEEAAKRAADLQAIVDGLIDYDDLAQRSLGEHWEPRTEAERAAYTARFKRLIELSYVDRIDDGGERRRDGYILEWEEEERDGETGRVLVYMLYEDTETELDWRLKHNPEGTDWMLHDLAIDGASIETTYRRNYGKIIDEEGFDSLIVKMDERIADLGGEPVEDAPAPEKGADDEEKGAE